MADRRSLKEFFGSIKSILTSAAGNNVNALAEDDGTPRVQSVLWHSGTTQIRQKAETDGTATASLYGTAPGDGLSAVKVEDTTHELAVSLHGTALDGSAVYPAVLNSRDQLQVEPVNPKKILGQLAPGAATETVLYTCPASVETEITSLFVANRSATATSFRLGVSPGGGALGNAEFMYYDVEIPGNETLMIRGGIMLVAADELRVLATLATVSFNAFGMESDV